VFHRKDNHHSNHTTIGAAAAGERPLDAAVTDHHDND
jgi:hypothetical protein